MADEVQLSEPAQALLAVAVATSEPWARRAVASAASRAGVDPGRLAGADDVAARVGADVVERLRTLLATDVDEQRTNPLSVYRDAAATLSAWLSEQGVPAPPPDAFAAERFPGDVHRLGPAAWSDVDPEMHVPGLTWGAWKAMVVLERRRDEGLR